MDVDFTAVRPAQFAHIIHFFMPIGETEVRFELGVIWINYIFI